MSIHIISPFPSETSFIDRFDSSLDNTSCLTFSSIIVTSECVGRSHQVIALLKVSLFNAVPLRSRSGNDLSVIVAAIVRDVSAKFEVTCLRDRVRSRVLALQFCVLTSVVRRHSRWRYTRRNQVKCARTTTADLHGYGIRLLFTSSPTLTTVITVPFYQWPQNFRRSHPHDNWLLCSLRFLSILMAISPLLITTRGFYVENYGYL